MFPDSDHDGTPDILEQDKDFEILAENPDFNPDLLATPQRMIYNHREEEFNYKLLLLFIFPFALVAAVLWLVILISLLIV